MTIGRYPALQLLKNRLKKMEPFRRRLEPPRPVLGVIRLVELMRCANNLSHRSSFRTLNPVEVDSRRLHTARGVRCPVHITTCITIQTNENMPENCEDPPEIARSRASLTRLPTCNIGGSICQLKEKAARAPSKAGARQTPLLSCRRPIPGSVLLRSRRQPKLSPSARRLPKSRSKL